MTTKAEFLASHGRPFGAVNTRTKSGLCLHRDNKTGSLSKLKHSAKGSSWENMIPNAFPLPAGPLELGGSCPGATDACKHCYAINGLEFREAFAALAVNNLRIVQQAHRAGNLVEVLVECVDLAADAAARFGQAPTFRWHSDGDVFAGWYARAIRQVALARPDVQMWIYTRSFRPGASHIGDLVGPVRPPNLHVFLSVDTHNVGDAARQLRRFEGHGVRAAILAANDAERAELEARLSVTSIVCPATGRYANDGHGSSFMTLLDGRRNGLRDAEMAAGACHACKFCFRSDGRSVTFRLHNPRRSNETAVHVLSRRLAA